MSFMASCPWLMKVENMSHLGRVDIWAASAECIRSWEGTGSLTNQADMQADDCSVVNHEAHARVSCRPPDLLAPTSF